LESKLPDKMDFEDLNLNSLTSETAMLFKDRIEKKGLKLNITIPDDPVFIKGEPYLMEQVLINLLDNSYKYTEKGEITISLNKENGKAELRISDTGIGIPDKSIEKIFIRFYVVNKSRSRQTGGTGLGLSIVKHIILLHKSHMKVKSTEGVGTEFTITIPLLKDS